MSHPYAADPHSGAGNCTCGRPQVSVAHPHRFTPMGSEPFRCCCGRSPNYLSHTTHAALADPEADHG